jgi:arsenite oxidase small subunit
MIEPMEHPMSEQTTPECKPSDGVISRREFLKLSGAALATVLMPTFLRKPGLPTAFKAQVAQYPRQVIGQLSALQTGQPVPFKYPWDHPNAANFLLKLKEPAGGGIGPDQNVVAFNSLCTHQGGPLGGRFHEDLGIAGPCPLHLTTFDLTRHGMVISGHATLGLPQILLELEGDDIVATGVLGLVYGYYDNHVDPTA